MNNITPFVALNMRNYWPNKIYYTAIEDEETHLWSAAVGGENENGDIVTLFDLEYYHYTTADDAVNKVREMVHIAMQAIVPSLN